MARFHQTIKTAPPVYDEKRAEQFLDDLSAAADADPDLAPLASLIGSDDAVKRLLASVFGASSYLSGLIMRNPGALQEWLLGDPKDTLDLLIENVRTEVAQADSRKAAMSLLRQFKNRAALWLALADIAGVWETLTVTRRLSEVADAAVQAAVRHLLLRAADGGSINPDDLQEPDASSGYIVLGLGKLGAFELNYSSDIDLIVFFDAERAPLADQSQAAPFFVRLTRDLVGLLQERTADGYVFRTDLRLRPDPGATQLALSTDAGLSYYESFGQNWERAALIKARVIAGDREAGEAFLSQLAPFVWRRYLDYAAIADIHAMKRKVHEFKGLGDMAIAGHNVKLGRGGIREIEFFVQTHQLIAGGRQHDLRGRETLQMLALLEARGWIDEGCAEDLAKAYCFLRHVEHRIQMIADEQTHVLPERPDDLERVARFCGFSGARPFGDALVAHMSCVQEHYDALFERLPSPSGGGKDVFFSAVDDDPESESALREMGFGDPKAVIDAVRVWRSGRYASTRSERARACLTELLPELLPALASSAGPDAAMLAFNRFLADLPAGVQLFSLLTANPSLLRLLATIMGSAPRLAQVLSRRAHVLDAVLDPGFFGDLPPPDALSEIVEREVGAALDYQDSLDRARVVGAEQSFLIGVRVLSGTISAEDAGGAYALLAENLIAGLHDAVALELSRGHGEMPGGQAAVLAMGKLGGREMTAASDLDLIVVYDFDAAATASVGTKPLAGGQYFARFTQRLITALSSPTSEGTLYEVDMRLRPSGNAGPVATHLNGFIDYQKNEAWTWEHLALTRARVVAGPEPLRKAIEAAIREVLCTPRDREKVAQDVLEMREKIEKEKGTEDIWDIKQVRGGLVDLEFIAQFMQVVHAAEHPEVLEPNTVLCLSRLADAELLAVEDASVLIPAARLYHDLTQLMRLCLDKPFSAETASRDLKSLLARAAGQPDFPALERHLAQTLKSVRDVSIRLIN